MEHSPIDIFKLHCLNEWTLFGQNICLNKAVIMMWVVVAVVTTLLVTAAASRRLVPGKLASLAEIFVGFIRDMILDTMGKAGMRFFPFLATLFVFILFSNLLGLIPGTYTITSQLVVTGLFALFVYGMSVLVGLMTHGIKFLGILVPEGTPVWLLPLMIPIELISQLARPLSLAVRLFANMTAGHTVLAVLFGMALSLPLLIGWVPFLVTVLIYGLEVFIAFIQAYIFTILTCVYLGDALHLHGHAEEAH